MSHIMALAFLMRVMHMIVAIPLTQKRQIVIVTL